ncbi:uncharacterized protein CTRU02_201350 [Colletotrichum truncatum]|uniref:Uncharacterized protein n=1 Tax=Colletotrichum truncatum TaxID=5467 RepID=A0ACC3ZH30_COLTU|nr:uncharacterized protein CTRU02_08142 [Colletotrichum truncatum]KAF6790622.1 hypothetical protein CTRU02_08142 [Colletotrichum truncatum]
MKASLILTSAILSFSGIVSAVELQCWGTGVPSGIRQGDLEWARKNRSAELGIPGNTKYNFRYKTCIDPDNNGHPVLVITIPRVTKDGSTRLASGTIECSSRGGPPDSTC